ncbi:MAG: pilus assembly protein PilP [Myxococcota bacterium]
MRGRRGHCSRAPAWLLVAAVATAATTTGCEEEFMEPSPGNPPAAGTSGARDGKEGKAEGDDAKEMPIVEFSEADFVESENSRDPFRDYAHLFADKSERTAERQRKVKASAYALDELKLVGIITRGRSSVMLTDPSGYGWVMYTGDFVGKPELVSVGGTDGVEVAINWRVDRIRPEDVVFIREDSAHPDIPPTTRVMPLYPVGEDS